MGVTLRPQCGTGAMFGRTHKATNALEKAQRYRQRAARLRNMAELEADDEFRTSLLSLAGQYDELASSITSQQDDQGTNRDDPGNGRRP